MNGISERREEAAGTIRSAGWRESVTVTWAPAPAPDRRPAVLQRALGAAADVIAPLLADVAVASARRLLDSRHRTHPVASSLRRQLASVARELPRSDPIHEAQVPVMHDLTVCKYSVIPWSVTGWPGL